MKYGQVLSVNELLFKEGMKTQFDFGFFRKALEFCSV